MVQSIDQALITEFSGMVHHEAQQMTSKLRPYCIVKPMSGDVFAYDGLGTVEAREIQGRNQKVTFDDIEHNRRKISRKRYAITLPIDSSDVRGALLDPQAEYAKSVIAGMSRKLDKVIYDASLDTVLTGRDFETPVSASADGVETVDATSGLTYEKLLEIGENFINNDVPFEVDGAMLTLTGSEHTALLLETELTSGDFTRMLKADDGVIKRGAGLDFVTFAANAAQPVIPVSDGQRALIAAAKGAFCLGISKEMSVNVVERDDYYETTQVQVIMEVGAVRTEGKLVQQVNVTA